MKMMFIGGLIAQSVEHRPFKAVVPGSSPGQLTIFFVKKVKFYNKVGSPAQESKK